MKKNLMLEVFENGAMLEHWAIDSNRYHEMESNGGQEGLVLYKGKHYLVQFDDAGPWGMEYIPSSELNTIPGHDKSPLYKNKVLSNMLGRR